MQKLLFQLHLPVFGGVSNAFSSKPFIKEFPNSLQILSINKVILIKDQYLQYPITRKEMGRKKQSSNTHIVSSGQNPSSSEKILKIDHYRIEDEKFQYGVYVQNHHKTTFSLLSSQDMQSRDADMMIKFLEDTVVKMEVERIRRKTGDFGNKTDK